MPRVSISDTNQSVEVKEGEIIYDSLHDHGITLPHGCLSGSCGACRIEIVAGVENIQKPGVIEKNTIESLKDEFLKTKGEEFVNNAEIRLACRAKVTGDIIIKPIK